MPRTKATGFDDHYQNDSRAWVRREGERRFYPGFPRAPTMDELAMAASKSKLVVHRVQEIEISCSDALISQGMRIDEAHANLRIQYHLIRDHGDTMLRDRARMGGLIAELKRLEIANVDLAERLQDSETRNDALADRLEDSETRVQALETRVEGLESKMDNLLRSALQLSVASTAHVRE